MNQPKRKPSRRAIGLALVAGLVAVAVPLGPRTASWYAAARAASLIRSNPVAAESWLEFAERWNPGSVGLILLRSQLHGRLGRARQMKRELAHYRKQGGDPQKIHRAYLLLYAQSGQPVALRTILDRMASPDFADIELMDAAVTGLAVGQQIAAARRVLNRWEDIGPKDFRYYQARGNLEREFGDQAAAEESLRRSLELRRDNPQAQTELAELLELGGDYLEAMGLFRKALPSLNYPLRAHSGIVRCLVATGETDKARSLLSKLIGEHPGAAALIVEQGRLESVAENYGKAIECFEIALRQRPRNPELRYALATALAAAGRQEQAARHFDYVREATSALQKVERLKDDMIIRGDDPALQFEIGSLLIDYGSRDEGVFWLRRVLDSNPDFQPARTKLGETMSP